MDDIDYAQERSQRILDAAIDAAKHSASQLPAVGQCYNCLTPLPDGVRFCDCDCRNDYTTRRNAEARRG